MKLNPPTLGFAALALVPLNIVPFAAPAPKELDVPPWPGDRGDVMLGPPNSGLPAGAASEVDLSADVGVVAAAGLNPPKPPLGPEGLLPPNSEGPPVLLPKRPGFGALGSFEETGDSGGARPTLLSPPQPLEERPPKTLGVLELVEKPLNLGLSLLMFAGGRGGEGGEMYFLP